MTEEDWIIAGVEEAEEQLKQLVAKEGEFEATALRALLRSHATMAAELRHLRALIKGQDLDKFVCSKCGNHKGSGTVPIVDRCSQCTTYTRLRSDNLDLRLALVNAAEVMEDAASHTMQAAAEAARTAIEKVVWDDEPHEVFVCARCGRKYDPNDRVAIGCWCLWPEKPKAKDPPA